MRKKKMSQGKEDQQHQHAAQWGPTYFEKPFHFSRNSTFPFTTLRSNTFSTTYSSSSSSSSAAVAAAAAAAGAAAGAGSGADPAGCSSSSAFLPFFPAMVASLTSDEGTSSGTKSRLIRVSVLHYALRLRWDVWMERVWHRLWQLLRTDWLLNQREDLSHINYDSRVKTFINVVC